MNVETKRKQRPDIGIDEYLGWCKEGISLDEYLNFEKIRVSKLFEITPLDWIHLIKNQSMKCYYCETDLKRIQQLILYRIIKPRKRGPDGYSGLHFELDHKNCDKDDNCFENIVASCYYCNNDKSNTFSCDTFKQYFGLHKNAAFNELFIANKLTDTNKYHHHLKGKPLLT
ncbi:MAG TPA: hypothetical protein VFE53_08555 [Mucilaginibacter sp.]|jgi:hypothetical protein|nr:hypothetical protein [Mucilaginibacter sp.]